MLCESPIFSQKVTYLFPHNPPHSPFGSLQDMRTGGHWFSPHLGQNSFQGLMIVIAIGYIPLSPACICFDNGYVGNQPVAWEEYCAEYWLKELQKSMDRCTDHCNITEIL